MSALQKLILMAWVIVMLGFVFFPPGHYEGIHGEKISKDVYVGKESQFVKIVNYGEASLDIIVITGVAGVLFKVCQVKEKGEKEDEGKDAKASG
jgi:hypothetical protein